MYESQRAQLRVLSNWADAIQLGNVRDMLRKAECEIAEYEKRFCTTDIGDGTTIYDLRPRPGAIDP